MSKKISKKASKKSQQIVEGGSVPQGVQTSDPKESKAYKALELKFAGKAIELGRLQYRIAILQRQADALVMEMNSIDMTGDSLLQNG